MKVTSVGALDSIKTRIRDAALAVGRVPESVTLVAVSKTFGIDDIRPLLDAGQRVFGENRVQEAQQKWPELRRNYPDIELHLIGPLQSNKAAEAVQLFDVIETVDRPKIAEAIAKEMRRQGRSPKLLVQVNVGRELQKAGIDPDQAPGFVEQCRSQYDLKISGLMCIPPVEEVPDTHFRMLFNIAQATQLPLISMGMSSDFEAAIREGATHVRVGSAIFGAR